LKKLFLILIMAFFTCVAEPATLIHRHSHGAHGKQSDEIVVPKAIRKNTTAAPTVSAPKPAVVKPYQCYDTPTTTTESVGSYNNWMPALREYQCGKY